MRDWYLLKRPSLTSGDESSVLDFYKNDALNEILETSISYNIELYNYDLSECREIKAIIQNNTQDTKLKTLSRQMLAPVGTCKAGMYVKYKNRYWIIVGVVDDNTIYEKAILSLCNYLLTWINDNGKVVQRWANISSASQYNHGETSTKYYDIRSDQLLVIVPDDDECLLLSTGVRFIIDGRCKIYESNFDDGVLCDTSNPVIVYEFTRSDSILFDYQDSGHFEFMVYQCEQQEDDGYYVIDGNGYWLCSKPDRGNNANSLKRCEILCSSDVIYNCVEGITLCAKFYDDSNGEVSVAPTWDIDCNFLDALDIYYSGDEISIFANDDSLVGKTFDVYLSGNDYSPVSISVSIRSFL